MDQDALDITAPEDGSADRAEARAIARRFEQALRADPTVARRVRVANLRLAAEWFVIIAVTYALVFGVHPLWLRALLLVPWSLYAAFALDNIAHNANHWPLFRSPFLNALWRASGVLVLFNPVEIRAIHNAHHRAYHRADNRERDFGPDDRGKSFWAYLAVGTLEGLLALWLLRAIDPSVKALGERQPAKLRELIAMRWAFPAWIVALAVFDWADTLFFFVPAVILVGSLASLVMNLTDHIPGDPRHPFRLATYFEPTNRVEEVMSALSHEGCATHLTHHLFPGVHWIHLRALQRDLMPLYERNGAPRSLIVNTALAGNPLRFAAILRELEQRRFDGLD